MIQYHRQTEIRTKHVKCMVLWDYAMKAKLQKMWTSSDILGIAYHN